MSVVSSDILHREPLPSERLSRRASEALTFAFARGTSESELLDEFWPILGESTVDPRLLESDLFVDELIDQCFPVVIDGRRRAICRGALRRSLLCPPASVEDTRLRQDVVRELEIRPDLVVQVERAYLDVRGVCELLTSADAGRGKTSGLKRRIEILTAIQKALQSLANLSTARSALHRAAELAEVALGSPALQRLSEVLAFEDGRTVLESRLKVGYDGTLRSLDIVRVTEREQSGFARGPVRRFVHSLWSALRGYRFTEEDVLSHVIEQTFAPLESWVAHLLRLQLALEFYLAQNGFRRLAAERGLPTCLPTFVDGRTAREYVELWNPWLLGTRNRLVPASIELAPAAHIAILTGPNSGGKTRMLQAVALTQVLAQAGAPVPARQAKLRWAPQIFLSLIERPSATSDEGRLGTELLRIREVFERCGPDALVVMDELCSGTNPSEGEQIFRMVLELFADLAPQVFLSTHFLDFAARLAESKRPHVAYLQVELGALGRPTYQFVPGVAETSLARVTAERLGVTQEELSRLAIEQKAAFEKRREAGA